MSRVKCKQVRAEEKATTRNILKIEIMEWGKMSDKEVEKRR